MHPEANRHLITWYESGLLDRGCKAGRELQRTGIKVVVIYVIILYNNEVKNLHFSGGSIDYE